MVDKAEKDKILKIVRRTLELFFKGYSPLQVRRSLLEEGLSFSGMNESIGCFVSLYKRGSLRGCIGDLYGSCSLFDNLIRNSLLAAFGDPRFPPLEKNEMEDIEIEVSILSKPVPIYYSSQKDLFNKIRGKGVILKYMGKSVTFLPQVWKQLPDPVEFLQNLALKAGLPAEAYKKADYEVYDVEIIKSS